MKHWLDSTENVSVTDAKKISTDAEIKAKEDVKKIMEEAWAIETCLKASYLNFGVSPEKEKETTVIIPKKG